LILKGAREKVDMRIENVKMDVWSHKKGQDTKWNARRYCFDTYWRKDDKKIC